MFSPLCLLPFHPQSSCLFCCWSNWYSAHTWVSFTPGQRMMTLGMGMLYSAILRSSETHTHRIGCGKGPNPFLMCNTRLQSIRISASNGRKEKRGKIRNPVAQCQYHHSTFELWILFSLYSTRVVRWTVWWMDACRLCHDYTVYSQRANPLFLGTATTTTTKNETRSFSVWSATVSP